MGLAPANIPIADYGIAQRPRLGGELEVFACIEPAGILQTMKNEGGGAYRTQIYNASGFGGVDIIVVGPNGLTGAIAGVIERPAYKVTKGDFFGACRAGLGELPGAFGIRGQSLSHIQVPDYDPALTDETQVWWEIGCTIGKTSKFPIAMSKPISCGLDSARWTASGKTEIPELTLEAKNPGADEGLLNIAGHTCTIMIKVKHERAVETHRIYLLGWKPSIETRDPESDEDGTVSATGICHTIAIIPAAGTAP